VDEDAEELHEDPILHQRLTAYRGGAIPASLSSVGSKWRDNFLEGSDRPFNFNRLVCSLSLFEKNHLCCLHFFSQFLIFPSYPIPMGHIMTILHIPHPYLTRHMTFISDSPFSVLLTAKTTDF